MPNHVTNTLSLMVDAPSPECNERLEAILNEIAGEDSNQVIDFAVLVPPPANMFTGNLGSEDRKNCAEEGIPNWYDWQCENWGTKWNAYDATVGEPSYGEVEIQFDTAWSAPIPVIEALRKKYPDLHVAGSWVEEGHQSAGIF